MTFDILLTHADFLPKPNTVNSNILSVEDLITSFDTFESKKPLELTAFPTVDEMKLLSTLDDEVMLVIDENDRIFAFKGNKTPNEDVTERNEVSADKETIIAMKPKFLAHTHPIQDKETIDLKPGDKRYGRILFNESLPSEGDLTGTIDNLPLQYIYNRFGRVTYQAIPNQGVNPQDPDGFSITQRTIINTLGGPAVQEVRSKGITDTKEALNVMGDYLGKTLGCGFKLELYEELGDNIQG